jgi:hypothetical protein
MAGMQGLLMTLITAAVVLYVATEWVLPMGSKAIHQVKSAVGMAGYMEGYGNDF